MKKWERIAATILTLLGAGGAVEALNIGFGSFRCPGPGFYPFWLAVILVATSLIHLLGQLGKDLQKLSLWENRSWVRPLLGTVVMFVYGFLLSWLGFFSATFLLFVAWLTIVEHEKWLKVALVSVLGTTSVYILFSVLLKIQLPHGILF
ncbi:MAG TPA: tripartite tricarboxylate transporter TctB family protein [Bacillota bacterium]|nr:tripartite tricarboxylate transporter TctB family protein [Bacillota bacterium]